METDYQVETRKVFGTTCLLICGIFSLKSIANSGDR